MKSLEEINKIRKEKREELDLRVNLNAGTQEKHILVCRGTGCTSSKSPQIIENFRNILKEKNIENVRVIQTGCFGLCAKGPIVIVRPEDVFYAMVTPDDCEEIINTFQKSIRLFYSEDEMESGYIISKNKYGDMEKYPLVAAKYEIII